jgi:exoribonuclease R
MDLPEGFTPQVIAEAKRSLEKLHEVDESSLVLAEFLTIDPSGSRDLDQALAISETGDGFTVLYAIADVAWFVSPGGAVDAESRRRGQTLYAPDRRVPLYPEELSEGGASLLPGKLRPAILYEHVLDSTGRRRSTSVRRAVVRSGRQLSYDEAQAEIDSSSASETLRLLGEIGPLLERQEAERGGVSLDAPEQEIVRSDDRFDLHYRTPLPVEGWNAQISLMTGIAAAEIQIEAGVGLLRTMPEFSTETLTALRKAAEGLGIGWPQNAGYAAFIRGLDPSEPKEAALLSSAARLFRGTGYTTVGSDGELARHAAIAAPYAHATAPLRRLADRFVNEVVVSACAGVPVPAWAADALVEMPEVMKASHKEARELERRAVDLMEAVLLRDRVGETFKAIVIESGAKSATVQVCEPAILATCASPNLPLGEVVDVVLKEASPAAAKIVFVAT